MPNYMTRIGEAQVLLEAPASGAFAKSSGESEADPRNAIVNMIKTIRVVAAHLGQEIGPIARATGSVLEVAFAVRADSAGLVMVSESTTVGQLCCTVRIAPPPPARPPGAEAPRPAGPPPGAPPAGQPPR